MEPAAATTRYIIIEMHGSASYDMTRPFLTNSDANLHLTTKRSKRAAQCLNIHTCTHMYARAHTARGHVVQVISALVKLNQLVLQ